MLLSNLFTVAIRSIKRQKSFAFIHILGLSLGMMVCLMTVLYSVHEMSYDRFHSNADRIYRLNQTYIWGDDDALFGSTGPAVMHAISEEVPEFERMTRVHPMESMIVGKVSQTHPLIFEEEHVLAVDDGFLDIFTFPMTQGDPSSALSLPHSIILTEDMAHKYFQGQNALGKHLELGEGADKQSYRITGITQNTPINSHIEFDFLISMNSIPAVAKRRDSWMWTTFVTFGLLREDANVPNVAEKVAAVPGKYLEAFLQKYRGISYQEFLDSGDEWNLYIQPLLDIHLRSAHVYSRLNEVGSLQNLYILWGTSALILILSIINFINLSTAKSAGRAKEVGIRKVIGSGRVNLIYQFLTESMIYVVVSVLIGFFLTELLLPFFNQVAGTQLSTISLVSPLALGVVFLSTVLIGLGGGVYPAFYLSSFTPAKVLKGKLALGLKEGRVRNILVTAQFTISITLIASTLIVQDQVRFWVNYDLGFSKENKIIVKRINRLGSHAEAFKNSLATNSKIRSTSLVSDTPPMIFDFDNFDRKGKENYNMAVNYLTVDENFLSSYEISILYGRGFQKGFNDSTNMVVNEHLTKAFGFATPQAAIGQNIQYDQTEFKIIGVVEDFNTTLSNVKDPVAILDNRAPIFRNPHTQLIIDTKESMTAEETQLLLKELETTWKSFTNKSPFHYTFVDQEYADMFAQTINFGKLLTSLATLAVIIACLGLLGLVAYVIEKRHKEIGVRKVLGATVTNIWIMLSSNFGKLLLIGFVIAAPISWYMMHVWIQDFELRTNISFLTIAWSGFLMVLIALLTTSIQTLKASRINPVDYLKEE